MQAKGVANVTYSWSATKVAVTKTLTPGTAGTAGAAGLMTLLRSQGSGTLIVSLTMDNGGTPVTSSTSITVQEPATDPWVARTPGADEKAVNNQFYARDNTGKGQLYYNGTLAGSAPTVFLKTYTTETGTDVAFNNQTFNLGAGRTYAFNVHLDPGKKFYKAVFGSTTGGADTVINTVSNLVCGDAYIIEGQSNALAMDEQPWETSTDPWVHTYGNNGGGWGNAIKSGSQWGIGYWGMDLGRSLSTTYHMPICIINGAVGGTRIDQHQANPADHYAAGSLYSIYSNLVTRVAAAKLTHGIRAVLWHQGEQNQGSGGMSGDYDWKLYQQYFVDMSAAWKQDYPNLSHYYIFQIWPAACGDPSACDQLREVQRTLPALFSKMRIMSTLGIRPGSSCHYSSAGWQQFSILMSPLIEQDFYGLVPTAPITVADVKKAYFTNLAKTEIALEFNQNMAWNNNSKGLFLLDGVAGKVTSGTVVGNLIKLQLTAASTATTITYLKGVGWDGIQDNLLYGANGLAALTFYGVDVAPPTPLAPSNLSATAFSASQINLAWTDNSNNETGFKIERSATLSGTYTLIATTAVNATTYNNTGLTANTPYFYKVSAINAVGNSAAVPANATTFDTAPTAPSNLTATAVSTSQINLAWTDNSNNETGFKIERAAALAGPYTLITTAATNATTYSSTGLTANTQYFYRVGAANTIGNSATVTANATTLVAQQVAQISISNTTFVYDGTAKVPTVVVTPANLAHLVTYSAIGDGFNVPLAGAPVEVGNYQVTVQITAANWSGSAQADMQITAAASPATSSDDGGSTSCGLGSGLSLMGWFLLLGLLQLAGNASRRRREMKS